MSRAGAVGEAVKVKDEVLKTMICMILDRSGSMSVVQSDVVGSVNSFIDSQKSLPNPAWLAMTRFDSGAIERFRPMMPLQLVEHLSQKEYMPRGLTPLNDAIGKTLAELEGDWSSLQPDRCIVVIMTDGLENDSREFTKDAIKKRVDSLKETGKWTFIFLGADIDAFAEGGSYGIAAANTATFTKTAQGVRHAYDTVSNTVAHLRQTGATEATGLGRELGESEASDKPRRTDAQFSKTPHS